MKMNMILAASTGLGLLAGCEKAEAPAPGDTATKTEIPAETVPPVDATTAPPVDPEADPATAPHRFASWAGTWTGVEGTYVTITPTEPEHSKLDMKSDLDTKGTYEGNDSENGIQLESSGKPFTLYRTNAAAIGLT